MLNWMWLKFIAVETSILPDFSGENGIKQLLILIVNVLFYGLGAAAVVGVVIAGITYLTARDNEQQVAKAKRRLIEIVIGLVAWAVMWGVLNWLIPGFKGDELGVLLR